MRHLTRAAATVCTAALAAAAAGCGATTKTVTVGSAPSPPQPTTPRAPATTSTRSTATAPPAAAPPPAAGTTAPSTTRSAPEPAFTQQESAPEGLSAAEAVVRGRGYTPEGASDYHSDQTLRVLIGTKDRSAGAFDQQAFFFVNGRYIGTDSTQPSATLSVVSQGDTEVTLAYPLYRASDPVCCPSAGQAHVRFQLNDGKLQALGPIPPVRSSTGLSRL